MRKTAEQKRLESIKGTTMPKHPLSTRENWTSKLAKEVAGQFVKVGYMDDTEPTIGVVVQPEAKGKSILHHCAHCERISKMEEYGPPDVSCVEIGTGEILFIDGPDQVYWARPIKVLKTDKVILLTQRNSKITLQRHTNNSITEGRE